MLINFDHYFQAPQEQRLLSRSEIQALVLHLLRGREIRDVELLSGGYRNQNYRLDFVPKISTPPQTSESDGAVLRVSQDLTAAGKEVKLLQTLSGQLPVPRVLASRQTSAHAFALHEFVPGVLASHLPENLPESALASLGAAIGATLARIHQIELPGCGFLDAQLTIPDPMPNLGDAWLAYMREVLHGKRAETRLGLELCKQVLRLLTQNEALLRDLSPANRLVHSDFNLKNLLVAEQDGFWQVKAVLDWEFAHAGSPLVDLGNFFRFEKDLPPALFEGFLQTYQAEAGALPVQWRAQARLLDLAAICNFLDSPESKPLTLETVKRVVGETLHSFA